MRVKKNINGKIELMRFLFSVIIVVHHSRYFLGDAISPFLGGSLAVEFFFFVSGYLMMASVERKNRAGVPQAIGRETATYLAGKWSSILPESVIAWIVAFAVMCIAKVLPFREMIIYFVDSVWSPIFFTMTGLGKSGANSVVWYVSAMLISMAVLYPLLRRYEDIAVHLLIPLGSLLIFGFLFKNYGTPRDPTKWLGWTYKGVLRALAEVGIGCLLYFLADKIRNIRFNILGRCLLTLSENVLYLIVIGFMYITGANKHDYFFIALMALAVAMTFSGAGIDSVLFNNRFIYGLGRFSVPLYFSHTFWASYLNAFVPTEWRIRYRLIVYIGISMATALAVMILAKGFRMIKPKLILICKRYLLEQAEEETAA